MSTCPRTPLPLDVKQVSVKHTTSEENDLRIVEFYLVKHFDQFGIRGILAKYSGVLSHLYSQLHNVTIMPKSREGHVRWQAFPSWGQFSWLYFFVVLTAFRGLIFYRLRLPGWEMWLAGTMTLLVVIFLVRHWALYILTPTEVIIQNGYTRREISSLKLEVIQNIELLQGPIARFWNIGTLVIQSSPQERELCLRGVKNPEVVEAKIKALLPVAFSET